MAPASAFFFLLLVVCAAADHDQTLYRGRRGPPAPVPGRPSSQKRTSATTSYFVITIGTRLEDDALTVMRTSIETNWQSVAQTQHLGGGAVDRCVLTSVSRVRIRTLLTIECDFAPTVTNTAAKDFIRQLVTNSLTGLLTSAQSSTITVDEDEVVQLVLPDPVKVLGETGATTGKRRKRQASEPDVAVGLPPYVQTFAQWHLDRLDQRGADFDGLYTYYGNATGYTAYIIDTGTSPSHDEFQLPPGRVVALANTIDGSGPLDCNGHGTHVTGLLAGTNVGVAKGAQVRVVKALDCGGSGTTSSVVAAFWVVDDDAATNGDPSKPLVINLSLNGPMSSSMTSAVTTILGMGFHTHTPTHGEKNNEFLHHG